MSNKLEAIFWAIVFALIIYVFNVLSELVIQPVAALLAKFGRGKWKLYGLNCWEGFDNYKSAQLGGDPDETVSSRLGKGRRSGNKLLTFIADKVDLVALELGGEISHSTVSIEEDEGVDQVTKY